jgi:hypothetical protein
MFLTNTSFSFDLIISIDQNSLLKIWNIVFLTEILYKCKRKFNSLLQMVLKVFEVKI